MITRFLLYSFCVCFLFVFSIVLLTEVQTYTLVLKAELLRGRVVTRRKKITKVSKIKNGTLKNSIDKSIIKQIKTNN